MIDEKVRDRHRLLLVVRDMDERARLRLLDAAQLVLHLPAKREVERTQRFVQQQHGRIGDERAGERDALALAAGGGGYPPVTEAGEADHLQRLPYACSDLRLRQAANGQAETDIAATVRCGKSA